jgi:hypothetical protein
MKTRTAGLGVIGLAGLLTAALAASGQAGIIGVIERIVFEPSGEAPERVQVWGAFTIAEYVPSQGFTKDYGLRSRGYLYFTLPTDRTRVENARREWADLKTVAGTKQAVAFVYWDRFRSDKLVSVRDAATKPAVPDIYTTDLGVTKLGATGPYEALVGQLLRLLER